MPSADYKQLCAKCGIFMPPGASHLNAEACIEALKHELKRATACVSCRTLMEDPLCSTCAVVAYGKGVLNEGAKRAAPKILGWMMGGGKSEDSSGGGKRFE